MKEEVKKVKEKKPQPEPKELFEQKMQRLEKEFDKQLRMRKKSGESEEETKGSQGSQIDDEYHYPAGAAYVPIPQGEEDADFGPPVFKRVMRNVMERKEMKKPMHPAAKAQAEAQQKEMKGKVQKEIKEEEQIRFKFMSYALLSDSFFNQQAEHLAKDDPCRDPRYRRRRVLAEIEESKSEIMCLQEVTNYSEKDNYFFKKLDSFGYKIVTPNQKSAEKG